MPRKSKIYYLHFIYFLLVVINHLFSVFMGSISIVPLVTFLGCLNFVIFLPMTTRTRTPMQPTPASASPRAGPGLSAADTAESSSTTSSEPRRTPRYAVRRHEHSQIFSRFLMNFLYWTYCSSPWTSNFTTKSQICFWIVIF